MSLPEDTRVLLQDQQSDRPRWLCFRRPLEVIQTQTAAGVIRCLEKVEERVDSGLYAAGFIGYEAASGFDTALKTHAPSGIPCLWFGIFENAEVIDLPDPGPGASPTFSEWSPSVSREQYCQAIDRIKHHIREGDTYQVNYTFRLRSEFRGDPYRLFFQLYHAQQPKYAAYIDLGDQKICSVSPEIFLSLDGSRILSKPMKGTVRRGYTNVQDMENSRWLHSSKKDRAENVMIVDMIRNDIGRVAETGSVRVPKLFEIERYTTVNQMTSTVTAETSMSIADIVKTMFPCASITGAPKVKTMEIIKELEPDPRGLYTGSIGYMAPGRKVQFNVAIRTVVLDEESGVAEYGVGGGITWGSETQSEYEECGAKAAVLTHAGPEFELLESLLWDPATGFFLLEEHLRRLSESAEYFGFRVSPDGVREKLYSLEKGLERRRQKVRLLLSRDGALSLEATPLDSIAGGRVTLSGVPIKTDTPYVYHKTTNRSVYTNLVSGAPAGDLFLWNSDKLITESTIANIVIDAGDGRLVTPPQCCGLLNGVMRSFLIERNAISESPIAIAQLKEAQRVFLINSVRGWMPLERQGDGIWRVLGDQYYGLTPPACQAKKRAGAKELLTDEA